MDTGEESELPAQDRKLQRRLRLLGICILAVGLSAAALIRQWTPPDDGAAALIQSGTLLSGNARRSESAMKNLGGQSNVVAADLRDWFASLWHGRRLAVTLAVLALGGSVACFFAAHLLNYPARPDGPEGPKDQFPGSK